MTWKEAGLNSTVSPAFIRRIDGLLNDVLKRLRKNCAADIHKRARMRSAQEEIGGARDSCGLCFCSANPGATENVRCRGSEEKLTAENDRLEGMRAGALLHAIRQASQSVRCCGSKGLWLPDSSPEQMMANGSKPGCVVVTNAKRID